MNDGPKMFYSTAPVAPKAVGRIRVKHRYNCGELGAKNQKIENEQKIGGRSENATKVLRVCSGCVLVVTPLSPFSDIRHTLT
jgi:hypothetical protein